MLQKRLIISRVKYKDSYVPKIRLSAFWLCQVGFDIGRDVILDYKKDYISLKLANSSNPNTFNITVGSAKTKTTNLAVPHIEVRGIWFNDIGFNIGDTALINATHGHIEIIPLKP